MSSTPPLQRLQRPMTLDEGRSLYDALAEMQIRLAGVEHKIDTVITMLSHRGRQPSLAELAAEITGSHQMMRTSSPPMLAWMQRGVGKIVLAVAKGLFFTLLGAFVVQLWHTLARP